ncbi:MAG: BlaI/MecI/CopY family transcriptional regulator [Candidatus Heimdallarchaeaceae archaeon]
MAYPLSAFLSEDLDCFDIVKAIYGLNETELETMVVVHCNQHCDIKRIEAILPKDRTTLTRTIQKLLEYKLIEKEKITLPKGGYKYLYTTMTTAEMKEKLTHLVELICKNIFETLGELSEEKCEEKYQSIIERYKKMEKDN